jgi:hypothetical protein
VVKLLPCDHEVMGSSPGNNLLYKCRKGCVQKSQSGRTLPGLYAGRSYVHQASISIFIDIVSCSF